MGFVPPLPGCRPGSFTRQDRLMLAAILMVIFGALGVVGLCGWAVGQLIIRAAYGVI